MSILDEKQEADFQAFLNEMPLSHRGNYEDRLRCIWKRAQERVELPPRPRPPRAHEFHGEHVALYREARALRARRKPEEGAKRG